MTGKETTESSRKTKGFILATVTFLSRLFLRELLRIDAGACEAVIRETISADEKLRESLRGEPNIIIRTFVPEAPVPAILQGKQAENCSKKRSYTRYDGAQKAAEKFKRQFGGDTFPYQCDVCGAFHLTKQTPAQMQALSAILSKPKLSVAK